MLALLLNIPPLFLPLVLAPLPNMPLLLVEVGFEVVIVLLDVDFEDIPLVMALFLLALATGFAGLFQIL